jgi:phosphoglycolate phosphatase-like HAD superfamily hydrolase
MYTDRLKVKGIFLDLDGTLVDSSPAYVEAANVAFSAFGHGSPELKVALEIPRRLELRQSLDDIVKD